jgi:SMI1 / KNR4 family (SUKH-1)
MTIRDRMREFTDRLVVTDVAPRDSLCGCTPGEILALEQKYGIRLPESYARFLELMGQGAGRLVDRNEFDLYYPHVLRLTEQERALWAEVRVEEPDSTVVELPPQSLIICGRRGEQFSFIDCQQTDDSPVFYFNHWQMQIRQTHHSLFGFLESMRADAEHWMAMGFPKLFPDRAR